MDYTYNQVTKIKVFGIGGAGCNAITRMVTEGMEGADFFIANTDMQVLNDSKVPNKLVLGRNTTKGQGAGADPEIGKLAAQESESEIREAIKGSHMVFITAGMGGGTGTGAAPTFARIAKEEGALTVAIVTKPFDFESPRRTKVALKGIDELKDYVDALIVISNNKLAEIIGDIPIMEAFNEADKILRQAVQTITDLISVKAMINLDFADVKSVMKDQGNALIGIGMAQGDNKAEIAAERAISSPLLEAKISGAKKAVINITGGKNTSIIDAKKATTYISEAAGPELELIWGVAINESIGDAIIVTVIATGFEVDGSMSKPLYKTLDDAPGKDDKPDDLGIPGFFKQR
jgi:cell division protein FtsZ